MAPPLLPVNLSVNCERPKPLTSGQGEAVYRYLIKTAPEHMDCADRHEAVVNTYNTYRDEVILQLHNHALKEKAIKK